MGRLSAMRVLASTLPVLMVSPAMALQQAAKGPSIQQPSGWPLIGYILTAVLLVGGIFLTVRASNRKDLDESGASNP